MTALDPGRSKVVLDDGLTISYDRLLLTTGSEPRRLAAPGANLDGIFYLRTLADSDALRALLGPRTKVPVVGAGWMAPSSQPRRDSAAQT